MTILRALQHAFNELYGKTLKQIEATLHLDAYFGRTAFNRIKAMFSDTNFSSAQRELDNLKEAYTSFNSDPKPFFEKILRHINALRAFGPNYTQQPANVCNEIINNIMIFGTRENAPPADKTWATFITNLATITPDNLMSVQLLKT